MPLMMWGNSSSVLENSLYMGWAIHFRGGRVNTRIGLDTAIRKFSTHSGIEHNFSRHQTDGVTNIPSEQPSSQSELMIAQYYSN